MSARQSDMFPSVRMSTGKLSNIICIFLVDRGVEEVWKKSPTERGSANVVHRENTVVCTERGAS